MPDKRIDVPTQADELNFVKQEQEWVKDGDDITIRCSACDMPLVQLVITRSSVPVSHEIVAECCHCGDKSFIMKITGTFALGACEGSSICNMDITDQEYRDGRVYMTVLFKTRK